MSSGIGASARTGTPVDRSVHIPLAGMEAMHLDWVAGAPLPGAKVSADEAARQDLTPRSVTAVLVGLKSRAAVFAVQRWVRGYADEPLMAVLPGVALDELWEVVGAGERALQAVSVLVSVVSLAGLMAVQALAVGRALVPAAQTAVISRHSSPLRWSSCAASA